MNSSGIITQVFIKRSGIFTEIMLGSGAEPAESISKLFGLREGLFCPSAL